MFETDRGSWPARVAVTCKDGRRLTADRRLPDGVGIDAETQDAVRRKFDVIATPVIGSVAARRLTALVDGLEGVDDVGNALLTALDATK